MVGPWKSYPACLLPSAAPTSSVSTPLGHAQGTSVGRSRKSSIAFGMKASTRRIVNDASVKRALRPKRIRRSGFGFRVYRKKLTQPFVGKYDGFNFTDEVRDHSLCR